MWSPRWGRSVRVVFAALNLSSPPLFCGDSSDRANTVFVILKPVFKTPSVVTSTFLTKIIPGPTCPKRSATRAILHLGHRDSGTYAFGSEDKHRPYRIRPLRLEGYVLFNLSPSSTLNVRLYIFDLPLRCSPNRGRSTDILAVGKEVERYHSHHYSYAVWKFLGTGKPLCRGDSNQCTSPALHRRPTRERDPMPTLGPISLVDRGRSPVTGTIWSAVRHMPWQLICLSLIVG
ncbi:hypothetical protein BJ322DRAFT_471660 [Thelephora terrestris]|uniref:Secreted protein n=1 Tax=Thelephora terrestris TaxID=56493 RepID=A0A9P6H3A5_9AGAM|nr:hypothetical protein BJ322DRAFT_471660 [Thelephora terrestris]